MQATWNARSGSEICAETPVASGIIQDQTNKCQNYANPSQHWNDWGFHLSFQVIALYRFIYRVFLSLFWKGGGGGWRIMQSWQLTLIDIENDSIKVVYCCLNAIIFCGWLTLIKNNIASKQTKCIINARTMRKFLLNGGRRLKGWGKYQVASHKGGGRCTLSPPPKQETLISMYVECLIPIFRRREASW